MNQPRREDERGQTTIFKTGVRQKLGTGKIQEISQPSLRWVALRNFENCIKF